VHVAFRLIALRFPLSKVRFSQRSAHVACVAAWLLGLVLAFLPLLPSSAHWHFYSTTSICIPLPVTRQYVSGHTYSFSIFIILNFVLFLFVAAGQVSEVESTLAFSWSCCLAEWLVVRKVFRCVCKLSCSVLRYL
jgi:hypothetical protein